MSRYDKEPFYIKPVVKSPLFKNKYLKKSEIVKAKELEKKRKEQ